MKKIKLLLTTLFIASFAFTAYSQTKSPKPVYRLGGFWDHWFISAGVGGQMYFGEDDNKAEISDRITPSFQLSTGKWITHFLGARLQFGGVKLKGWNDGIGGEYIIDDLSYPVSQDPQRFNENRKWTKPRKYDKLHPFTLQEYDYTTGLGDPAYNQYGGPNGSIYAQEISYVDAHIDVMFNLTSAVMGYKPNRVFNLIPYIGFGWAHAFGDDYLATDDVFTPVAGMMFNFRVSDAIDLGLDVKGTVVPESFDSHIGGGENSYWRQEGYLSATLGLTYKFKQREFEVVYEMDPLEIQQLNDKINALYIPRAAPSCPECAPAVKKTRVFLSPVHFPLDVHLVQKKEMYKVELAAKYLREEPSRTLHLEGYADRQTGTTAYNLGISERRVREVRRLLIEKYGVDANRLTIGWQGDIKQPFDLNELNRAVLFVGDEEVLDEVRNYNNSNSVLPQPSRNNTYTQQNRQPAANYGNQNVASQPQASASSNPYYSGTTGLSGGNGSSYTPPASQPVNNNYVAPAAPVQQQAAQSNNYYTPPAQTQDRYTTPPPSSQNTGRNTTKYIAPNSGVYQFNR